MRRSAAWLVVACCAATALPMHARAEEPKAADQPKPVAPPRSGETNLPPLEDGVMKLSLDDAVHLAIERSLDVELLRFDPLVAEEQLGAAWGIYDPQLYGQGGYQKDETLTASQILGNTRLREENWSGESGLQGLFPWLGGSYQVGYQGSELVTNSRISVLSPEFRSGFTANVTVPLLRGLFWSDEWTLVRVSRIGVQQSREKFDSDLMDVVRNTEDAYWNLIATQDSTHVAEKSLETAKALLQQTEAQYEVGVVSHVEVVQAEAGVADREFSLIRAQAVERNAQDALIDVVLGPYLEPETEIHVEPTDRPEERTLKAVSAAAATEHAMARRPELQLAQKEIERRMIDTKAASNKRLPQLDAIANYGKGGISGRVSPNCVDFTSGVPCTDPPGVRPNFNDSGRDLFNRDSAESYGVAGVLSIPLGNNTARHEYAKAELELRRAKTAYVRLEQSIVSEIRRAARNLAASFEGIEAAERAEAAAAEQLRAERVRLEHGESTPFDVLLREEDLVRAESQKILAEQTYHNSITALDRAQGTILERHQIAVEQAAVLR